MKFDHLLNTKLEYLPRTYDLKDLSNWKDHFLPLPGVDINVLLKHFSHSANNVYGEPHRVGFTAAWGTEVVCCLSGGSSGEKVKDCWASFKNPFFTNDQELRLLYKWFKQKGL